MSKTLTSAIKVAEMATRPGVLRAVAYLRVSTEEQAKGYGIAYTEKKVLRYFEKKGYAHVGTFADEGLSGSLEADERPDLKRLMELARQEPRPFDLVGVNEGRTIGRTGRAFWRWVWELEDLGIYVAVAKKDYDNSTQFGRSQMRKDADYAEEERELIRDRTQGGIQEAAEAGLYPGGNVPFGWVVKEGRYAVSKKAAATLKRGHEVFLAKRSWREVALTWNSEGRLTGTGQLWTSKNARRVMLSEATVNNRIIWRGKAAARRSDGTLAHGEQVIIPLPKIFSKKEAKALRKAAASPARPATTSRTYMLSGILESPCGSHYRGHNHRPGVYSYQCKGREEKYAGSGGTCSCPQLDVEAVEKSVWRDTAALLCDADRMKAMAKDWMDITTASKVDHVARIAQLDQKIAEQRQVLNISMSVAARQATRDGLEGDEAESFVEAAIAPLSEDLSQLTRQRDEAVAWQRDAEQATQRLQDLDRLARMARENLQGFTPEEKAEACSLMELQAKVVRADRRRVGQVCRITDWFASRGRVVPTLTDEAWALVEPLLKGRRGSAPRRPALEGLLRKATTGDRFQDLEVEGFTSTNLQNLSYRWLQSGAWDEAMELLKDLPGEPPWSEEPVHIRVSLRPMGIEFCVGAGEGDGRNVGRKGALQLTFMTAA